MGLFFFGDYLCIGLLWRQRCICTVRPCLRKDNRIRRSILDFLGRIGRKCRCSRPRSPRFRGCRCSPLCSGDCGPPAFPFCGTIVLPKLQPKRKFKSKEYNQTLFDKLLLKNLEGKRAHLQFFLRRTKSGKCNIYIT